MRSSVVVLACISVLLPACFTPDVADGTLACSDVPSRQCPEGYYCTGGTCWHNGHAPANGDLGSHDLAGVDQSEDQSIHDLASSDSATTPTCIEKTMYVSASTGSDANPGCDHGSPKKTIGAALAAGAASGTVKTIEVCAGTYMESPLVIDFAASLEGSYDCDTWMRTASSTYGYPTFDPAERTVIENVAPNKSAITLAITGFAAQPVVVDGFTILGATTGSATSAVIAVGVAESATATISNNQIVGGNLAVTNGNASGGVWITTGASATISSNSINGGSGQASATGVGSLAIFSDGSSTGTSVIGNAINGGSGSNSVGSGSAAIKIEGTSSATSYMVQSNIIQAGTGTGSNTATFGILVNGTPNVTLDANSIDGGDSTTGAGCSYGAELTTMGTVRVTRNRIYGGDCSVSNGSAPSGLILENGLAPIVYNNMIHAGTSTSGSIGAALVLRGGAGADVRHNTLVAGSTKGSTPSVVYIEQLTTNVTLANNILAGTDMAHNAGVLMAACPTGGTPAIETFENNLVMGTPEGLLRCYQGANSAAYSTMDAVTTELMMTQPAATVQGNVTIAASCGTDSRCITSADCTTPLTCLSTLFAGWDVASAGKANLFEIPPYEGVCTTSPPMSGSLPPNGNGWTLANPPPCMVSQSSYDDTTAMGLGVDLYGNCRSTMPSMGAEEDSAASCQ